MIAHAESEIWGAHASFRVASGALAARSVGSGTIAEQSLRRISAGAPKLAREARALPDPSPINSQP